MKQKDNPVRCWVEDRIKRKGNVIILITGDPNTGKTYAGISAAAGLWCGFNTKYMINNMIDLMKLMEEATQLCIDKNDLDAFRGTVIVYEEPQEEQYRMRSTTSEAVSFVQTLSTFRSLGAILILTTPKGGHLQTNLLQYVDLLLESDRIDYKKELAYFKIKAMEFSFDGKKIYKKYPLVFLNGVEYQLTTIAFKLPPGNIAKVYDMQKLKFQNESYKAKRLRIEKKHGIERPRFKQKCKVCGYEWESIKENVVKCLNCQKVMNKPENRGKSLEFRRNRRQPGRGGTK